MKGCPWYLLFPGVQQVELDSEGMGGGGAARLCWRENLAQVLPPDLCPSTQKGFKDTSRHVVGELAALESERRQIDTRASRVQKRLRYLMDTGDKSAFMGSDNWP
ncbi:EH domain-binding protein 1 isoform X1 [Arapaima gigas]